MKQKLDLSFWKLWNLSFGSSACRLPMLCKTLTFLVYLQHWELTPIR